MMRSGKNRAAQKGINQAAPEHRHCYGSAWIRAVLLMSADERSDLEILSSTSVNLSNDVAGRDQNTNKSHLR